jgi:hypothetical protein
LVVGRSLGFAPRSSQVDVLARVPLQRSVSIWKGYADLYEVGAGQKAEGALVHLEAYGAEDKMHRFYYNDLIDVQPNVGDVQVHWNNDEVRDGDVRDIEDPVVPSTNKSQGCRADSGEEDEGNHPEYDIPILDASREEARHDKEDEVEDCVKNEEQIDDAAEDLMSGFKLFV